MSEFVYCMHYGWVQMHGEFHAHHQRLNAVQNSTRISTVKTVKATLQIWFCAILNIINMDQSGHRVNDVPAA